MSNNRLTFEGMDEFLNALRNLPEHLTEEATNIVDDTVHAAESAIRSGYPSRAGELKRKLTSKVMKSGVSVVGKVQNTSRHALPFETGTQARHTALGANRGAMPPGHVFFPIVDRYRRQMYERLKDLLVREGLLVSGDA